MQEMWIETEKNSHVSTGVVGGTWPILVFGRPWVGCPRFPLAPGIPIHACYIYCHFGSRLASLDDKHSSFEKTHPPSAIDPDLWP